MKVYQYKAGFLHAKTVTVDHQLSIIGTCNWDIRSFILHDEVVSIFYDRGVATNYGDQYERDIQDCVQITEDDLAKLTRGERFRNSCYRLFSRCSSRQNDVCEAATVNAVEAPVDMCAV